ncbi:unnamed protein product [Linum tenue]|uniref:F-box domain-containing protein n=1 Tax=Linum tenue TaxID=586396 RepID=A0AAV0JZI9_9ROSI|nr:unnamed protein product [Linum tenue]
MEPLPPNPMRARVDQPQPRPILPPELIAEIFTWLPVDSLLRFRCVCKSFKTLISSTDFVKSHLRSRKALSNTRPNRAERLFRRSLSFFMRRERDIDWRVLSCSLYSVYNDPQIDLPELGSLLDQDDDFYDWIIGSCDGLLCSVIYPNHDVVVWNPSTRVSRSLPNYEPGFEKWRSSCYTVFGFGYDFQLDDYKVVAVLAYRDKQGNDTEYQTSVNVFSLRTRAWRKMGGFHYGVPLMGDAKFAAGSLYYKMSMSPFGALVSLDLATETYDKVVLPDLGKDTTHWELETLIDCLSVSCFNDDGFCTVWVMKELGWTKLFRVGGFRGEFCCPLYISDIGEVLWETYESLIIYNYKDKSCRLPTSEVLKNQDRHSTVYMETLVSPMIMN